MEDGVDRYKYFMRFLLEGKIIPSLKALRVRFSSLLLHEPWRSCNQHTHTHTHTHDNRRTCPAGLR